MAKRMGQPKPFSKMRINDDVPDQSGVYDLLNRDGEVNYTGQAGAGRLRERVLEHLRERDIPGVTHFRVRPTSSGNEAKRIEKDRIKQYSPPYNSRGT